ncbi:hypothetical protein BW730_14880 [Tessaracoccus aquimaris]|uniref:Uncharacterized protein n=1 Tax=Tessaracoccus aquimaris TaxID=1332264 RepID=A0A1Q2CR44_9ACTN|nr:hypothetical protein [Tessaracoccus aquimaris]AQP48593.1 hypothetical protein BW730_14880 [Tessaracoccus aquimaris]
MFHAPDLLLFLVPQVAMLALYIVGVIRSAGVARILLAIWVVIHFASTLFIVFVPGPLHPTDTVYILLNSGLGAVGSILLALALILGRPGYRGDPQPGYASPGYPPAAGPNPGYGSNAPYGH